MNESMNDEAVCRTAPATPGLLITYKQWESIDRTDLVTHTDTVPDFLEKLIEKLQKLKLHQFIHSQQTSYYYSTKENLSPGEALVVGDFSENCSFVYKDAVQGVH